MPDPQEQFIAARRHQLEIRHVPVCHRRRGLGRLRAGQPPVGRPGCLGPAARGGRQGQLHLDPHPHRLPLHDQQPAHRLALRHGAGAGPQRPGHRLSAGPGPGRLFVDQRHDLHARSGARLRRLAADGQRGLGLGRRAAVFPEAGGLRRGGGRVPRQWRGVAGRGDPRQVGDSRRLPRRRGGQRHPRDRRLQPRQQRGLRLLQGEPKERRALEHVEGVPAPGPAAAQPDGADTRAGRGPDPRRQAGHGHPFPAQGHAGPSVGAGRGHPVGGRHRLTAAAPGLGHRPRRPAGRSTGWPWPTRCRAWARTCRTTCSCA